MQRSLEQRMAIKFCVKLEKSAAETIPMLKKAFGVDCLSDRQIFRWHKAFAEGLEDVNDKNRAGRPSTSISDDNVSLDISKRTNVLSQVMWMLACVNKIFGKKNDLMGEIMS
ncbi:hypothetical protein NQ318_010218 [Aromia moschata]|uniref:Mos1 transposase HTH domain-containing protein n=1 Tax=Aromia moschata TaxID=1265417 RepID=A0AAV8XAM1_9CUCU|nr:hypothetical protein NQ318_010218 [Aromia moschata]